MEVDADPEEEPQQQNEEISEHLSSNSNQSNKRYTKNKSLQEYFRNRMQNAEMEVERLKTSLNFEKNKKGNFIKNFNPKTIQEYKPKAIPYTDMALHISKVEQKVTNHGGAEPHRMVTYLLESLEEKFKINVEGLYPGALVDMSYQWLKATLINHYSSKGLISTDLETAEDRLNKIYMKNDMTVWDLLSAINVQRIRFLKTPEAKNQKKVASVEKAAIDVLRFRSCEDVEQAINKIQREWKDGTKKMFEPKSTWISLQNFLQVEDPLREKTKSGSKPRHTNVDDNHSTNKKYSKTTTDCKFGLKCTKGDACKYTHRKSSNNKREFPSKEGTYSAGSTPSRKRVKIEVCNKCAHKHPVDNGCESCWKCHPDLAPKRNIV